jgi:outer membrane protein TolC
VNVWSRRFVALLVGAGLVSSPIAAGQSPPAPQVPAPQVPAAPAQAGPTLPLSMEQAVALALENNLGLQSARLTPEVSSLGIAAARAAFLPSVSSTVSRNTSQSQPFRNAEGTETVPSSTSLTGNASLGQDLPWYGAGFQVSWSGNRRATAGSNASFNPQLGSTFFVGFRQPLWQGFRIDSSRASLERAERQKTIADLELEERVLGTQISVRFAYLDLIGAIERRKVVAQNMAIAQQSLFNAQARVKVGQAPEIDITTAQVAVANNRDQVIQSDAQVAAFEDRLRALILNPDQPDFWTVRLEPTDTIELTPQEIDVNAAIANALANRLDLIALKRRLEITDLNIDLSRNLTRPAVDLNVNYSASGSGGNGVIEPALTRGFGPVLGDAFGGAYPSWTFSLTTRYPLGRSSAEASLAQAEITRRQEQMSQRQMELGIVQEVRQAARQVEMSFQRVQATQAARAAAERQLDAENQKYSVGLSNSFELQIKQREQAQAALAELQAKMDYNRALIEFDRVQKIR